MKLASYKAIRPGLMGVGNILIRFRLKGEYSHTEIVFEEKDFVDDLLPDHSAKETKDGLWSFSSVGLERLPEHSKVRAGELGGARFKRIKFDPSKWDLIDISDYFNARDAIIRAKKIEGSKYDWLLIGSFVSWLISQSRKRYMCNESCGAVLGMREAWRTDPCSFRNTILFIKERMNVNNHID